MKTLNLSHPSPTLHDPYLVSNAELHLVSRTTRVLLGQNINELRIAECVGRWQGNARGGLVIDYVRDCVAS